MQLQGSIPSLNVHLQPISDAASMIRPANLRGLSADATLIFTNGKRIYDSRGGLQLVPPFVSNASPNKYFLKLYKGDPTNPVNEITSGDNIDWQVDYYSGVVFIQDYNSSTVPVSASAYLYVGKFLNEKISSGTNLTIKEEGSNLTTVANSINFVGAHVTASTSGNDVTVTVNAGAGIANIVSDTTPQLGGNLDVNGNDIVSVSNGNIELDPHGSGKVIFKGNATKGAGQFVLNCENNSHGITIKGPPHSAGASYTLVLPNNDGDAGQFLKTDGSGNTSWDSSVSYGRTAVTGDITSSVSDRILGVSATASLQITLPAASTFSSGQHFIIKDEAGNANSNIITVSASTGDRIDGQGTINLESPYAAVNLYSNGTNKFFIY